MREAPGAEASSRAPRMRTASFGADESPARCQRPPTSNDRRPSRGDTASAGGASTASTANAISVRASTDASYSVSGVAYTRLPVDERRAQLLELSTRLFAAHSFAELSMARIAREAGISKALLYHYFPSKQDLFLATLAE